MEHQQKRVYTIGGRAVFIPSCGLFGCRTPRLLAGLLNQVPCGEGDCAFLPPLISKPRTARIAPGGTVFHVLNRANASARISGKNADYAAFERVMIETLAKRAMGILGT
jgi:hypothetical protein